MAIEDNTSYELTGAQIKDLASKINAKADASDIPTVNNATLTITKNGTSVGTFTANSATDTTIALTDTTYSDFVGATTSAAGSAGLVPAPVAGDDTKFLAGDGTWKTASAYDLPIASASTLGGIKVGDGLNINSSTGVLSANAVSSADWSALWQ